MPKFGIYDDGLFKSRVGGKITKQYKVWSDMLLRCYCLSKQEKQPSYRGCSASDNFQSFQFFARWFNEQPGAGSEGFQLDKDILLAGNKVYCEELCVFVPGALNKFLCDHRSARGNYPQGVIWHKASGKYVAQISRFSEPGSQHLGTFNNISDAMQAYKVAKDMRARDWERYLRGLGDLIDHRVLEVISNWEFQFSERDKILAGELL